MEEGGDLKETHFVRVEKWSECSRSIISELEHTPLPVEEMLRLWILNESGRGDSLVNRDGM